MPYDKRRTSIRISSRSPTARRPVPSSAGTALGEVERSNRGRGALKGSASQVDDAISIRPARAPELAADNTPGGNRPARPCEAPSPAVAWPILQEARRRWP